MAVFNLGNGNDNHTATLWDDTVYGNGGHDILNGVLGKDTLYGGSIQTAFHNTAFDGNDELHGHQGDDTLYGGTGNDKLYGEADHDRLFGGFGNDQLFGGSGNDALFGNEGDDRMQGAEELNAGKGEIDYLSAGTAANNGRDTFVLGVRTLDGKRVVFYNDGLFSTTGIKDYAAIGYFNKSEDKIQLAGSQSMYVLKDSPLSLGDGSKKDTGIFLKGTNGATDELIGVIQDISKGNLSLGSSYFKYV